MDLRLTFNEDVENYEKHRPTYTKELFEDVISFSRLGREKKAIEIGIGTGQATLPFLKTGCGITAVEIGDKLARFTADKFADYGNFKVINQDFEGVALEENCYDLVYSASAFHWIPPEIGLPKVYRLLKRGGVFAWFSNQPMPSDENIHVHQAVQAVYDRYAEFFKSTGPAVDPEVIKEQIKRKCLERGDIIRRYGFADVYDKLYYGTRVFTSKEYVELISTYSDHRAMPEQQRIPFYKEIAAAIDKCGGRFILSDSMILCMGRKSDYYEADKSQSNLPHTFLAVLQKSPVPYPY